nr:(S)-coclaurine N-methyltransferase-like [Tanacetum cinerariifolium]
VIDLSGELADKNEIVEEIELQKERLVMLLWVGVTKRLQRLIATMWIFMIWGNITAASTMILRCLTLSEQTLQKAASLYGFELCQIIESSKKVKISVSIYRKIGLKNVAIIVANVSTFEMEGSYDHILSIEMFEV